MNTLISTNTTENRHMPVGAFLPEEQDVLSDKHRANPHKFWMDLRKAHSIVWSRAINGYLVLRHQTACEVINNPDFSTSIYSRFRPIPLPIPSSFELGEQENKQFRKLIHRCFAKQSLPVEMIRATCIQYIEHLIKKTNCDAVSDFAVPMARSLTSGLLGITQRKCERLADLLALATKSDDPIRQQASAELVIDSLLEEIESKKSTTSSTDLFSALVNVWSEVDHNKLDLVAYIAQIIYSLTQGTANQLTTNAILALTKWPNLQEKIRALGAQGGQLAAMESARWEPINQAIPRIATSSTVIDNVAIKPNDFVLIVLTSTCRDEQQFHRASQFVLDRKERSLAFGRGKHTCLGGDISVLITSITLTELLKRVVITLGEGCNFVTDIGQICTKLPIKLSPI